MTFGMVLNGTTLRVANITALIMGNSTLRQSELPGNTEQNTLDCHSYSFWRHDTGGSFVKAAKIDFGRDIDDAAIEKYGNSKTEMNEKIDNIDEILYNNTKWNHDDKKTENTHLTNRFICF